MTTRAASLSQTVRMATCRIRCEPRDLERFRSGALYQGPIKPYMVFEWEPDLPHAADTCQVIKVEGDKVWTYSESFGTCWNDESRFREAVVASLMKDGALAGPFLFGLPLPPCTAITKRRET